MDGNPYKAGYVESMAVLPTYQRQGIGKQLMLELNKVVTDVYDFGALSQSDEEDVMTYSGKHTTGIKAKLICDYRAGDAW